MYTIRDHDGQTYGDDTQEALAKALRDHEYEGRDQNDVFRDPTGKNYVEIATFTQPLPLEELWKKKLKLPEFPKHPKCAECGQLPDTTPGQRFLTLAGKATGLQDWEKTCPTCGKIVG